MPDFSVEFWVATGVAAFTFVLGLGMTLAMDAKTRGEFRFAAGCFLFAAASTVYLIGVFEMSATWPARLRVPIAWALFATVAVLTSEGVRWAHARHLRASALEPSKPQPPNAPAIAFDKTPHRPPARPRPPEKEQPQPSQTIIQVAPTFGNIKQRAIALSREIILYLTEHGWNVPPGSPLYGQPGIQQMPTGTEELQQWVHSRSSYFRWTFLPKVLELRNEFAQIHLKDQELDDFFSAEGMIEETTHVIAPRTTQSVLGHDILPQRMERIAERLQVLANQVPQ